MSADILSVQTWQKSGMNPKTLQYIMGHSDISVTIPVPNSNTIPVAVHTDYNYQNP